jgi:hypothetical protein
LKQVIDNQLNKINRLICSVASQTNEEQIMYFTPTADITDQSEPIDENRVSFSKGKNFECVKLHEILDGHSTEQIEESQSSTRRRKRTNTNSLTRKKKLRSNSNGIVDENANDIHHQETDNENPPIDYLSLQPERIVSITRSRTSTQQLEFLLKCTLCPTKLYFISNEKAKELVPDLLIDFYERHINWFIDRPSSRQKTQRRKS